MKVDGMFVGADVEYTIEEYFRYKNRQQQLRRELSIANKMVKEAEWALRDKFDGSNEYLTWS